MLEILVGLFIFVKNLSPMAKGDNLVRFDWAIKRLLRNKTDHTILNGFLSSLLGETIRIEKILESDDILEFEENKYNRVDMLAEDSRGRKIVIEVQNETEDSYFHRMLFSTSKILNDFLRSGSDYDNIAKVYCINIVYINLGEGSDYVYKGKTEFHGLHNGEKLKLSKKLQDKVNLRHISDIFPEYYILKVRDFEKVSKTPLDQWMYFLKHSELPEKADAPGLQEAAETLRITSLTREERREYEKYIDNMISLEAVVDSAWSDGHYKGKEEGIVEGEKRKEIEIARKMIKSGMELSVISSFTGLSEEELKNI